jgi:cytidylate kinase
MTGLVIDIDGPAASGKSSTAQAVAEALGFTHLDSGALYRGATLVGLRQGIEDALALVPALDHHRLALHHDGSRFTVWLGGESVEQEIRDPAVTARVSAVSALPPVRNWVNQRLRGMADAGHSLVVDGRDIGTVVFPDAPLKVFLTASPRTRAARRLAQRGEGETPAVLEREAAALTLRDEADSRRAVAPLRLAEDAVPLDGTGLSFEAQVAEIVRLARTRIPPLGLS